MFKNILVPLDGSKLAESALAPAVTIAQAFSASITLFHVIEKGAPSNVHGDRHLASFAEAQEYLDSLAQTLPQHITAATHVHANGTNDVARSIVDHTLELERDLIVMCTHGSGGFRGFIYGSIAQQVLSIGETPLMLMHRVQGTPPAPFECKHLLVPLDGDPEHEQALPVATAFMQAFSADLHLLAVVHTLMTLPGHQAAVARLLPGTARAYLSVQEEEMQMHLKATATRLSHSSGPVTWSVKRGDPVHSIVRAAEDKSASLILMGTHGKSGSTAFWANSVAPGVSNRTRLPLLLVPINASGLD